MAEFRYFAIHDDVRQWLAVLSGEGHYRFVLEKAYREPTATEFRSPSEMTAEQFATARGVFVLSDKYSRCPPVLREFKEWDTGQPWYSLSDMVGGPVIQVGISSIVNEEWCPHRLFFFRSMHYSPYYRDPNGTEWFKPPEAMKQAYQQIRALIRREGVKRRVLFKHGEPMVIWFGVEAMRMIQAGELYVAGYKQDAVGKDRIVPV